MDDELSLDIGINFDDEGLRYLMDLATQMKSLKVPIDNASAGVYDLDKSLRSATGPADRLYRSMIQLNNARLAGSASDQFDAQVKYIQAQKSYAKAQQSLQPKQDPSFLDKFKGVLMSSRFGSGGLMPLVGQTINALGIEAVGAAAAVKLLWDAANDAAQSLTEFRAAMNTSGGTASEVAKLNATGLSDPAGLSRTLSDALKDNGAGTAAGTRVGIHDYGNALSGPVDKANNLLKVIDTIGNRNKTSDEEAIRLARALHVEQVLALRDVSDTTKNMAKDAARASAEAHNPDAVKNAAEFNAQMSITSTWFDTLKTDIGESFLPQASGAVELIGDLAHGLHDLYGVVKPLVDLTSYITPLGLYKLLHEGAAAADAKLNEATERNTEAINRNTDAAIKAGTYGGGDRARNAFPSAWGGANARNWDGQARALGSML